MKLKMDFVGLIRDSRLCSMEKQRIISIIDQMLGEWDPLGILVAYQPVAQNLTAKGEYFNYVVPLIKVYVTGGNIDEYLIRLHRELRDEPNEEVLTDIRALAERFKVFLNRCPQSLLKDIALENTT
jgi:hypothetical protein